MRIKNVLVAISFLSLLGYFSIAVADSTLSANPDTLSINQATILEICRTTYSNDVIKEMNVTDPSGSVWTYAAAANQVIPPCPTIYTVSFGGSSSGWVSDDGDTDQTDEVGTYTAVVEYIDMTRKIHDFAVDGFVISVAEFALPAVIAPGAALGYLAIRSRLRRRK